MGRLSEHGQPGGGEKEDAFLISDVFLFFFFFRFFSMAFLPSPDTSSIARVAFWAISWPETLPDSIFLPTGNRMFFFLFSFLISRLFQRIARFRRR